MRDGHLSHFALFVGDDAVTSYEQSKWWWFAKAILGRGWSQYFTQFFFGGNQYPTTNQNCWWLKFPSQKTITLSNSDSVIVEDLFTTGPKGGFAVSVALNFNRLKIFWMVQILKKFFQGRDHWLLRWIVKIKALHPVAPPDLDKGDGSEYEHGSSLQRNYVEAFSWMTRSWAFIVVCSNAESPMLNFRTFSRVRISYSGTRARTNWSRKWFGSCNVATKGRAESALSQPQDHVVRSLEKP